MPKLVLEPVDAVKHIFPKESYAPLAIVNGGYYVIVNDRNMSEVVEYYLFTPVESENGIVMEAEINTSNQQATGAFYPNVFSNSNRMLDPGKYWNVGMDSLCERIKTVKGIRELGFELSREDELLMESKVCRISLFKAAVDQVNIFLSTLSDGYNPSSISCLSRTGIKPAQLNDVVNYLFYDHGLINGIRFEPQHNSSPVNVKVKTRQYLDLCFGHATTFSKCNQVHFEKIKDRIFYDLLAVIEDWQYEAYFLDYTGESGGDRCRVIILDEDGCLLVLCLDTWFH